MILKMVKN